MQAVEQDPSWAGLFQKYLVSTCFFTMYSIIPLVMVVSNFEKRYHFSLRLQCCNPPLHMIYLNAQV